MLALVIWFLDFLGNLRLEAGRTHLPVARSAQQIWSALLWVDEVWSSLEVPLVRCNRLARSSSLGLTAFGPMVHPAVLATGQAVVILCPLKAAKQCETQYIASKETRRQILAEQPSFLLRETWISLAQLNQSNDQLCPKFQVTLPQFLTRSTFCEKDFQIPWCHVCLGGEEAFYSVHSSRKLALASWSCSCFSKLSDGVDAPQKPQIID